MRPNQIQVERSEELRPDDRRSSAFLARLSYSLPQALADLIDNSIDAHADNVLIRLVRTDNSIQRVLIVDNGDGMDDDELREAMRFGSKHEKSGKELGKYGVGLKTASLSQSRAVTVLSVKAGDYVGRRWTSENIALGWRSEVLVNSSVESFLKEDFSPVNIERKGTIIVWEELEHLKANPKNIERVIHETLKEVSLDLGLKFHRFIKRKDLKIFVDVQTVGSGTPELSWEVEALDPFDYPASGKEGYPRTFNVDLPDGKLALECHIWPARTNERGYKLGGGKVAARQGFYFFRNDRLIQVGGWNRILEDDAEPHLSLARVKIDLPPSFDSTFKLDIRKSNVDPPPEFAAVVEAAANRYGTFEQFKGDARTAYGRGSKKANALFHHVPGRGFPASARKEVKRILWEEGSGKPRKMDFAWSDLEPHEFVSLDRENEQLLLNEEYRSRVLNGASASGADAPLVKLLLFLLFNDEFTRRADSARYREWIEKVNRTILVALRKA